MIDLVYIASPSFSGSTLLTFMLNAHPRVATVGELKWGPIDLSTYECSCQSLLAACPFWSAVTERMRARDLPFNLQRPATDFRCRDNPMADRIVRARLRGPLFERVRDRLVTRLPTCRRIWPLVTEVNRGVIETVLEIQGGGLFADSSKDPVRLKYLLDTGDYNVWVIHLIRDGRGVLNSIVKNEHHAPEIATREWLKTHQEIERIGRRVGADRFFAMRYEDLCSDPTGVFGQVCDFLGIDSRAPEDYRAAEHHILGNGMRLRPTADIKLDEKWRRDLPPESLTLFEHMAGDTNRRYGYE